MTKKSLSDMLKEEVTRENDGEGEVKVVRRNSTKADLESQLEALTTDRDQLKAQVEILTADRDQLKAQVETLTTDRDQLKAQVETLTTDRDQKQAHIQQLQAYLEQAQTQLKSKAEIVPNKKPLPRPTIRPIGSNEELSKLSGQNIGWFD